MLGAHGATVFHHSGWLSALQHENRQPPVRLACEEPDGTLSGILPLMATRGLPVAGGIGTHRRLSSLPRTPVAGPIGTSDAVLQALVGSAMARARRCGLRLQLKQAARNLDGVLPGLSGTPWRLSYVKPLPGDPDRLRFGNSRNHARVLWAVRKARREGLRVRDASSESDVRDWYRLYLEVSRWRGLPARSYRLFQSAWEGLRPGGFARLLLVHREQSGKDVLLAGSMVLMLGDTAFYAFNGRRKDVLHLRPNDLLQWHAMRDATAAGYRWYDFGEVAEGDEGLARFKAKWETEVRPLIRYHAPPLASRDSGYRALDSKGRLHSMAVGAWRRVPLPVTAFAGERLYRFL